MGELLLRDRFDYPDGVITNEYATRHRGQPHIHESDVWEATSGTLFSSTSRGYSGVPDGGFGGVDIDSAQANGSGVLRVITRRMDFVNVSVRFRLVNLRLVNSGRNDDKAWNGFHVFMRRQDENNTYYVDVNRRDNRIQIKRKLLERYVPLAELVLLQVPYGVSQAVRVDSLTLPNGAVELRLYVNGELIQQAADNSINPILSSGSVGIRADNCECLVDDFEVWSLGDLDTEIDGQRPPKKCN